MIPALAISLLAVAGFALVLSRCQLGGVMEDAVELSTAGVMAMLDRDLDDAEKEVAVRRAGLDLIVASWRLLWRLGLALAAAAVPVLLADAVGLVPRHTVLELMLRLDYVLAVSVVAVVGTMVVRRWRPADAEATPETNAYSTADRLLHAMAFARPGVLRAASRLEDRVVRDAADEPTAPPIFVTSLARAGTTALLNALHDVPGIATHTYRDMPFLTAPSLWYRLAGGDRRQVARHERAHGDGLEIDLDSPEAFEEVVWRLFWPDKYGRSAIGLWGPDDRSDEAEQFLRRHMGKVIRARRVQGQDDLADTARYCSKNNANIARLDLLPEAFPDCRIVVPVRRPECHAASLLRQHDNFLRQQADDDFVRRYMRDLGHFEFGRIHRPILFPGFDPGRHDPATGDYWLDYWIHTFREVLAHADRCVLVAQDDLRAAPQETMRALCDELALPGAARPFADYFRPGRDEASTDGYDPRLLDEAMDVYRELASLTVGATSRTSSRGS